MATKPSQVVGMDLRLSGLPVDVSARDLHAALSTQVFQDAPDGYYYLVVIERTSEDRFWEHFNDTRSQNDIAARIIMPRPKGLHVNTHPSTPLVDQDIHLNYHYSVLRREDIVLNIHVTKVQNPATADDKYQEMYELEYSEVQQRLAALRGISYGGRSQFEDGRIGYLHSVSCGNFDEQNRFEAAHAWHYNGNSDFEDMFYFSDAASPKFRICLSNSKRDDHLYWEWMDIHQSNIRGVIFEEPGETNRKVVYFVIDKAPQFYERSQQVHLHEPANTPGAIQYVHSRITHPYGMSLPEDDDIAVCNVPWMIQYFRVYRIEYEADQELNFASYQHHLSKGQKQHLYSFNTPRIVKSSRTRSEMADIVRRNMRKITDGCKPGYFFGFQLGIVKLLYNCNLSATSAKTTRLIDSLLRPTRSDFQFEVGQYRILSETLHKFSQDVGTSHSRALHLMLTQLPDHRPQLPAMPKGELIQPQQALYDRFDLKNLFHQAKREFAEITLGVFEVLVHPSHVELQGPIEPSQNSIIDMHEDEMHRFLRVKFVDNNTKVLKVEAGISLEKIIGSRVYPALHGRSQSLLPFKEQFEFLAYTMSSLKKRKAAWFIYTWGDQLNANAIRNSIGDWRKNTKENRKLAKSPSKWAARVSLAFTESTLTEYLSPDQWRCRDDVGQLKAFPNSDGCGLITPEFCVAINRKLWSLGYMWTNTFQIRFGGAKGMVYAGAKSLFESEDPKMKNCKMLLRRSQIKFDVPDWQQSIGFRVASTAGENYQSLFQEWALKAFEDSHGDTRQLLLIYQDAYHKLSDVSDAALLLLEQILRIPDDYQDPKSRHILFKLAIRFRPTLFLAEYYANTFLGLYLAKIAIRAREKHLFEIPIPHSYHVLGLTDDYQILRPDSEKRLAEVFLRAQHETVEGEVLIYRDPMIHIGDLQRAMAISEEEMKSRIRSKGLSAQACDDQIKALLAMNNVIFFCQEDNPPFPSRLSGGDLDGDRFDVLTEKCGFWTGTTDWKNGREYKYQTSMYDDYTDSQVENVIPTPEVTPPVSIPEESPDFSPCNIEQVAHFVGDYFQHGCFEALQDHLMILADQKRDDSHHDGICKHGMHDKDVKRLAPWLSKAVDFPKNGGVVNMAKDVLDKPEFQAKGSAKPDFLRPLDDRSYDFLGEYYESPKLLGRIYHWVKNVSYFLPEKIDNQPIQAMISERLAWTLEILEAVGHIHRHEEVEQLGYKMHSIANEGFQQYCDYVSNQYLVDDSEIELFLRKPEDNFPNRFVDGLVEQILNEMSDLDIVDLSAMRQSRLYIIPGRRWNEEDAAQVFKFCLLKVA